MTIQKTEIFNLIPDVIEIISENLKLNSVSALLSTCSYFSNHFVYLRNKKIELLLKNLASELLNKENFHPHKMSKCRNLLSTAEKITEYEKRKDMRINAIVALFKNLDPIIFFEKATRYSFEIDTLQKRIISELATDNKRVSFIGDSNNFTYKSVIDFLDLMREENLVVEYLNLEIYEELNDELVFKIAEMLKNNTSLREVFIQFKHISNKNLDIFLDALKSNQQISEIRFVNLNEVSFDNYYRKLNLKNFDVKNGSFINRPALTLHRTQCNNSCRLL